MKFWVFKSEPDAFSIDDLKSSPKKTSGWDGVRNYQARNNMRAMDIGDRGFFYHSQKDKAIVGIVEVIAQAHPDSTTDDPRWECVDIRAIRPLESPVTLDMCKTDERLEGMVLVNNSRLSVQPVRANEWTQITKMAAG